MKFDDVCNKTIFFGDYGKSFIYFLIKDEEVVYIGKTTAGLKRPFSHLDKDFDTIKIIDCAEDDLGNKEDYYISKYYPIYNKSMNSNTNISLKCVRDNIRKFMNDDINLYHNLQNTMGFVNIDDFTITHVKRLLNVLSIIPGKSILRKDYQLLLKYLGVIE